MSARAMACARRFRAAMLREMGGRCAWCRTKNNLEFDCIQPTNDGHATVLSPELLRDRIRNVATQLAHRYQPVSVGRQ